MRGHLWFVDKSLGEINWGDCQLGGKTILKSPRDGVRGEQSACEHLGDIHTEKIPGTGGAAGTEFTWTERMSQGTEATCLPGVEGAGVSTGAKGESWTLPDTLGVMTQGLAFSYKCNEK